MGLLKAALSSGRGILADQWKEYFYADALPDSVLAVRGKKRNTKGNNKGNDNVISNGSIIAVANGQCMMIVEQGAIVDLCAEPGEYTYDMSTEPSLFCGDLGKSLKETFKILGKRFTFGGEVPKDQRVYYFNTRELVGNKYGTPSPVPFRVVDQRAGIDMDISIRCFGEYSFRIADPMLFYTNLCGNMASEYSRDSLSGMMKTELLTALQPAFSKLSAMGIRYSELPGHTMEMGDALNEVLSKKWRDLRGIEIVSFGISSVTANPEDEKVIKEMQREAAYMDPSRGAAYMAHSYGEAMKTAAGNAAGAMTGFMGVNMAGGGSNPIAAMYQMGAQQQAAASPAPAAPAANGWKCSCGAVATGNFCPECGAKKPAAGGWTCSCGAVNKGKFCSNCGAKKPAGAPQYKCDKCGWEPEDPAHPPRFCPECGDPFGDEDIR